MLIILSMKNGECLFYLTKWVWIKTRKKKNQQMKQQKDYSCFYAFFP